MLMNDDRRDAFKPLAQASLSKGALEKLAALGVTTIQELRDFWEFGNRQLLIDYLGESPVRITAVSPSAMAARGGAAKGTGNLVNVLSEGRVPPLVKKPRGLLLTAKQAEVVAEAPAGVTLSRAKAPDKPKAFLGPRFPAVRNQGQRGTCVAFASIALLEYRRYGGSPKTTHHSEQFVFHECKTLDGIPNEDGTYLHVARRVLATKGACLAKSCAYDPLPGATVAGDRPTRAATAEAAKFTLTDARELALADLDPLRARLDDREPIVLSVLTYPSWDYPSVADTGEVPMPLPRTNPDGGHAVCLVGYEERADVPGGGAFIFRNSWGAKWARPHGRFGGGYGTLSFDSVRKYGLEAYA